MAQEITAAEMAEIAWRGPVAWARDLAAAAQREADAAWEAATLAEMAEDAIGDPFAGDPFGDLLRRDAEARDRMAAAAEIAEKLERAAAESAARGEIRARRLGEYAAEAIAAAEEAQIAAAQTRNRTRRIVAEEADAAIAAARAWADSGGATPPASW